LLETFKLVNDELASELLILGEGKLYKQLKYKAENLNIDDNVHFLGYKNNPYKFLKLSDIFVQTSYYEGLSNAMLEALAMGLPVVTTYNPDNIIRNGYNGFEVNHNSKEIAEKIIKLNNDKTLIKSIVENNHELSKKFDFKDTIRNYRNLFLRYKISE